jgi:hypothetical protein
MVLDHASGSGGGEDLAGGEARVERRTPVFAGNRCPLQSMFVSVRRFVCCSSCSRGR